MSAGEGEGPVPTLLQERHRGGQFPAGYSLLLAAPEAESVKNSVVKIILLCELFLNILPGYASLIFNSVGGVGGGRHSLLSNSGHWAHYIQLCRCFRNALTLPGQRHRAVVYSRKLMKGLTGSKTAVTTVVKVSNPTGHGTGNNLHGNRFT